MQMTGYTKLFGSIITSTIWRENKETKILWITMLALKNKAGIVEGSVPGLADMARLSLNETLKALEILRSPDEYSRTKKFEGRRIEDIDGGWLILNHEKWRNKMNADERREYLKIKQREHRARVNKPVNKRKRTSTPSTHTDADTDPLKIYCAYPLKVAKPDALRAIQRALSKTTFDDLLRKTKAFAAARNGDTTFCPNPATWFNQERFNDDPKTWKPKQNGQQPKQRAPSYGKLGPVNNISEDELAKKREEVRKLSAEWKAQNNR